MINLLQSTLYQSTVKTPTAASVLQVCFSLSDKINLFWTFSVEMFSDNVQFSGIGVGCMGQGVMLLMAVDSYVSIREKYLVGRSEKGNFGP